MTPYPEVDLPAMHARMRGVVEALRLPFGRRAWRGQTGNWLGVGLGASIDFQDHRPYLPGDDPRYINWLAYARSGQYTMKLYREEVSPNVDLVLDASASMALEPAKWTRAVELFYFSVESALQAGASLRCSLTLGADWMALPMAAVLGHRWMPTPGQPAPTTPPPLDRIPLRHGSMRVWISDLLFPGAPEPLFRALTGRHGRATLFSPYVPTEEDPPWQGNVELVDCESERSRRQRVPPDLLRRYRRAYRHHFELWQDLARKYDVPLVRLTTEGDLTQCLYHEGLPARAVETWA